MDQENLLDEGDAADRGYRRRPGARVATNGAPKERLWDTMAKERSSDVCGMKASGS